MIHVSIRVLQIKGICAIVDVGADWFQFVREFNQMIGTTSNGIIGFDCFCDWHQLYFLTFEIWRPLRAERKRRKTGGLVLDNKVKLIASTFSTKPANWMRIILGISIPIMNKIFQRDHHGHKRKQNSRKIEFNTFHGKKKIKNYHRKWFISFPRTIQSGALFKNWFSNGYFFFLRWFHSLFARCNHIRCVWATCRPRRCLLIQPFCCLDSCRLLHKINGTMATMKFQLYMRSEKGSF